MLVKSTIFIVGNSNFEIVYFKRYIFILCGENFRFVGTMKVCFLHASTCTVYKVHVLYTCHLNSMAQGINRLMYSR